VVWCATPKRPSRAHASNLEARGGAAAGTKHGQTPADRYTQGTRPFPLKLEEMQYPSGMHDQDGKIRWMQARCRVGDALAHELVGIEVLDDGLGRIWFGPVLLGQLDERKGYSVAASKDASHWPRLQSPASLLARRPAARHD